MIHKRFRKSMALVLTASLLGMAACQAEPVTDSAKENAGQTEQEITLAPEVNEAIDAIKENETAEEATRTATITLSDNGITVNGIGCKVEDNCLKIKEAGTYEISGSLSNGSIVVNAEKESEVQLILNGVTVHNETSAPLFCKKASKVTITLAKGSENTLTDGAEYVFEEGEDEPDSALFSKQDLIINGEGKLTVTSAYGDAIKGKDSLYILGGTVIAGGVDDGIVGKDLLYIGGGEVTVNVVSDALKSTNDTDETLGNIIVEGGTVFLMAGKDGIQAEGSISVKGGELTVSAGDDGVHAEKSVHVEGDSKLAITKSVEGIEGLEVVIDGGVIEVTSQDDGVNAAGGSDTETTGDPRAGMFGEGEGEVIINGGTLTVNAGGDGIDANGNVTVNGGTVVVFGPTGGGNGVLDFGGSFCVNGGTLLAVGSSEMAQAPSETSTQCSFATVLGTAVQAGSVLTVEADGQEIISKEVPKRVNYIVVSSATLKEGANVTVKADGEVICEGTITGIVTSAGGVAGMGGFGFGGKGGFGQKGEQGGRPGGWQKPDLQNGELPQMPEDGMMQWPEGQAPQMPEGELPQMPEGEFPQMPEGGMLPWQNGGQES